MLRSISVCNFIHYLSPQRLEFENGVNFIIGGNSTGKSAMFELIRRCLSNKINTTTSSVPKEDALAYTVCHFKINGDFPESTIFNEKPENCLASVFIERNDEKQTHSEQSPNRYYKVLCLLGGTSYHIYVQRYKAFYGCDADELLNTEYLYADDTSSAQNKLLTYMRHVIDSRNHSMVHDAVEIIFSEIKDQCITNQNQELPTHIEGIYHWLDERYVGVMSMRSIGPLQWTQSEKNKHEFRDSNYETACERAEILSGLLGSNLCYETEKEYHQILVHPYEFKKEGKTKIVVRNNERDGTSYKPLLKTPVGIIEAKQLTLILSHKKFQTITLEEPDQNMHPHMMKKFRDLILRKIKGKTILVTSHNPFMINQWALERTFVCCKRTDGKMITHHVNKVPPNYFHYGRLEEMRVSLFSSRILFVEGVTDKRVLEAVFDLLINDFKVGKSSLPINFKQYLLATEILELSSAREGNKKRKFCEQLMKETIMLFDSDVFAKELKNGKIRVNGKDNDVQFDETFDSEGDFREDKNFSRFEEACEKANVFSWKAGAIEARIIEVLDMCNPDDSEMIESICRLVYLQNVTIPEKNIVKVYKTQHLDNGKEIMTRLHNNIMKAELDDVSKVAEGLITHSAEIKRFINFLQKKENEFGVQTQEVQKEVGHRT